jgi:hypothetical protein
MRCHLAFVAEQALPDPLLEAVLKRMERFIDAWAAAWARFGTAEEGRSTYGQLLGAARRDLNALGGARLSLRNELALYLVLDQLVFQMALAPPRGAKPFRATAIEVGERRLAS